MNIFTEILYDLTIQPIRLLLEIVFKTAYSFCYSPGASLVFVSLVVNILVLPLYLRSDHLQERERQKQKDMKGWVKHIRKTFKGDERFMILSEYYRQNDYQPYYVLKSSLSLLLQIPFFIAAYQFLSQLQLLSGTSFGIIKDLGRPDAMIHAGSFSVNVLPILMTVINLVSSMIYTKGGPLREKLQTVGMALIFLVLLYNSPAGLVFYWTLNNLFSLGKNVVMSRFAKVRHPKASSASDAVSGQSDTGDVKKIWLLSSLFISTFVGMIVPMSVITASPLEFIRRGAYADPASYSVTTTATVAGFFLVWGGVIFFMGSPRLKRIQSTFCLVTAVTFFLNYTLFTRNFGLLWDDLVYSEEYRYSFYENCANVFLLIQICLLLAVLAKKQSRFVIGAVTVLFISTVVTGGIQTVRTSLKVRASDSYRASTYEVTDFAPVLKLSRTQKNVVILVLDKALSGDLPYILNEKPELAEEFSGFTYYPNTVSFSGCTISAAPAMYGGYEYTTYDINQRTDKPLKEEMNESLKLLPTLFASAGFHSTMCDIPYGNFQEESDLSIFDDIPSCKTLSLTNGAYSGLLTADEKQATDPQHFKRNIFYYSLCRVVPLFMQSAVYDNGRYHALSSTTRISNTFVNNYVIMKHLQELTEAVDDGPQLIVMHNNITHDATPLDPPDYVLTSVTHDNDPKGKSVILDGRTMNIENDDQMMDYDINMCAMILTAKWLQTLRQEGVYDNTRIIIVADHGVSVGQFDDLVHEDLDLDVQSINPLFMVKDFNASGPITTDYSFMSNADTPVMALKDIVPDPVNPFTGNPVSDERKFAGPLIVNRSTVWNSAIHDRNVYKLGDSPWYTVHDNIFDADDWSICD